MTEIQVLSWIRDNLTTTISKAIAAAKNNNPKLIYTEDWIAGIIAREVGGVIAKQAPVIQPPMIWSLMKGDFNKRPSDEKPIFHGFGVMQIDIASFPDFVASGDWKDPVKTIIKGISVLEGKRKYLSAHCTLTGDALNRAITAAYNCGEGNVIKVINAKQDIDARTADHNYSADVWHKRVLYNQLPSLTA